MKKSLILLVLTLTFAIIISGAVSATNSTDTNYTTPQADIAVTKSTSDSISTWREATSPKYIVVATNNGPNDATNVVIQDKIPEGLEYLGYNARSEGTVTYNNATRTLTWTIGLIPNKGSSALDIFTRVTGTGIITNNTAKLISLDQIDPNNTNNESSVVTYVPTSADIEVTQTTNNPSPTVGSEIILTLTTRNNGPDNATEVQITDLLPSGLILNSVIASQGNYNPLTGVWNIGTLNNGQYVTLILNTTLNTTNTLFNNAKKTSPTIQQLHDWNPTNNAQQVIISPTQYTPQTNVVVSISTSDAITTWRYATSPKFIIVASNSGPNDATNVIVRYVLPEGLEYLGYNVRSAGTVNYDSATRTLTWTLPFLPYSGSSALDIFTRVTGTGTITNTVNATNSNKNSSINITVPTSADIEVTQNTSNQSPQYLENVILTVTAKNNGPDQASGIKVTDILPSGIIINSINVSQGTYDPLTGVWDVGTLNNGASAILTFNITINSTAISIINEAKKTAPSIQQLHDWNPTDNSQQILLNIPLSADIKVTQTVSNSTPTANSNVNFIINTTNNGPDNASGVQVTSKLPTGFTVSGWKVSWNGGLNWINNDSSYNPTTGLWTIGALANGVKAILNITANATQMGNFTNNATKTAETQYDWNSTNNAQNVSLAVTGTIPDDIFTDEGTQSGTINTDDGTTTAITLPFNITLYGQTYNTIYITVNGAIGLGAPIQGPYYYQLPESNTLNRYVAYIAPFWADFDVANIGSITYLITNNQVNITWYQVPCHSENTNTNRVNTVTLIITNQSTYAFIYGDLDWKNDPNDSYPSYARISKGDNGATYKNFWTGAQALSVIANKTIWFDSNGNIISPHIGLTYTVNNSTPNYHDNVIYTIVATNTGTINATGVKVKALLPSGLNYVSSSSTAYDSATGIWNIGTLAPGESLILTLTAYVNKVGSIISYANTTAQDQYETNPYDTKTLTLTVPNAAHIAVTYTVNSSTPNYQGNVVYTITATNNGPSTATGINLTSKLPSGLTYVSSSSSNYNSNSGIWNIGTLNNGASATLTITAKVAQTGTITTYANTTAQNQYDPTGYDKKTLTLTVPKAADIGVTVSASTTQPGLYSNFYIYIDVVNNGPDTANGVEVTTSLPSGISFVSVSNIPQGTSYNSSTGKWTIGTLAPGQTVRLALRVERTFWLGSKTVTAQKTAETEYDPVTTNNSGNVVIRS